VRVPPDKQRTQGGQGMKPASTCAALLPLLSLSLSAAMPAAGSRLSLGLKARSMAFSWLPSLSHGPLALTRDARHARLFAQPRVGGFGGGLALAKRAPLGPRCMSSEVNEEKTEEEKERIKAEREARKAEKEAAKAAKKAEKEAAAAAAAAAEAAAEAELSKPVTYLSKDDEPAQKFGDYATIMSRSETGRSFQSIHSLGKGGAKEGDTVWVRARVANVRGKGGSAFLVLRAVDGSSATVQACFFKSKEDPEGSKQMIKFLQALTQETIIDLKGTLAGAEVRSCTQDTVELQIDRCYAVSRAPGILPFQIDEASRSEDEIKASQDTDKPFAFVYQDTRLDNRWLDLRVPANNAIMRIQSGVCQLFREALYKEGFVEIHTPKIIPGASEGGAEVFRTDYFGKPACLAQSPQIYKQMAVSADLGRVFEIGPVFRAENSNTRRHLCEFTGLDLEMAINDHYNEVLSILHEMFRHIFTGLEDRYSRELAIVRKQYASEPVQFTERPCIVHWDEGMQMLMDAGEEVDVLADLSGAQELKLGQLVKEKYGADFFMMDRYPANARPFYTMPCPDNTDYTNSYDLFIRGQEICSGAQRVHDPALLERQLEKKGMPLEPLKDYIEAFRHGVAPHAGAGIGLERVVFLYLGLDNVRKASMFPRDPNRCTP